MIVMAETEKSVVPVSPVVAGNKSGCQPVSSFFVDAAHAGHQAVKKVKRDEKKIGI